MKFRILIASIPPLLSQLNSSSFRSFNKVKDESFNVMFSTIFNNEAADVK
jgi:hypothetical protein